MLITFILYGIVFLALLAGSYTDLKTREVPDWINYALIFSGLGLRFIFSAIHRDWSYAVEGLLGFGLFFLIALAMFYTGQWGGGDSKMLMGVGALIGLELSLDARLFAFFVNILVVGAVYGIIFGIVMAIKHRKKFLKEAKRIHSERKKQKYIMFVVVTLLLLGALLVEDLAYQIPLATMIILIYAMFYLTIMMKSVENVCMLKRVSPEQLTEGDWIVNDVMVNKKRICGPKDLGIAKEQIAKLIKLKKQRKVKNILIKEGIPFVPSFLIGFLVTIVWGNWVLAAIL